MTQYKTVLKAKDGFKTKAIHTRNFLSQKTIQQTLITEQELRDQIVYITWVKWRSWFTFHTYKELCKVFECNDGDYDYVVSISLRIIQ